MAMKKLKLKETNINPRSGYNITGAAGEFLVAAELSRRGIIATLTIKNTPFIDIIATNPLKGKVSNIQVKTRSEGNTQGWVLGRKVQNISKIKNHAYVFVKLSKFDIVPDYYIIPNNIFAKYQLKIHSAWMKELDRKGNKRKDNDIRNFKPESRDKKFAEKYHNNWKILRIL